MSYLVSLIRRHPLISFFVLAYALSWWPIAFYAAGLSPSTIISFGPFLAALVVLAATQGKTGVVGLLRRIVRWRVGLRWYAVALLLPVVVTAAAAALNVLLLGAKASSSVAELGGLTGLFSTFALLLLIPGIGGSWEEPGWRGYALPRLQTARSALFASLILGVVWAFWHLPLFITGQAQWSDIVFIIVWTITFTWVFNNAEGSVLIVVLMHNMNNTISGAFNLQPDVLRSRRGEPGLAVYSAVGRGGDCFGRRVRAYAPLSQAQKAGGARAATRRRYGSPCGLKELARALV